MTLIEEEGQARGFGLWLARLGYRVTPWVLGAGMLLSTFASGMRNPYSYSRDSPYTALDHLTSSPIAVTVIGVLAAIAAVIARKRQWPLYLTAAIGWSLFSMWLPIMLAFYYAALMLRRRRDTIAFLLGGSLLVAVPTVAADEAGPNSLAGASFLGMMLITLLVLFPYTFGLWVRARRQVVDGLRERAARLEREQAAQAERARAEERAHIAREMHDVVAHRVSLMVLHAGALEVNAAEPQVAHEAALIRTTGRQALAELRQVLGVLRGDAPQRVELAPQPRLADLPALFAQVRAAGVPVTVDTGDTGFELPAVVERTAYRVVQEGLTNVVKHAGGAPTRVSLHQTGDHFEVIVENEPPAGPVDSLPGGGLGLIGLRERIALAGGELAVRHRLDGGFRLQASLPTRAPAEVLD